MTGNFKESKSFCDNRCRFCGGLFDKLGEMIVALDRDDYRFARPPNTSFIKCLCQGEQYPLRIYSNASHMMKILGCGTYEKIPPKIQKMPSNGTGKTYKNPVPPGSNVAESPLWTQVNMKKRGDAPVPVCSGRMTIDDVERRHRLYPGAEYTLEEIIVVGAIADIRDQDDPCEDMIPDWRDRQ